ncbi:dehydrodolichyl diphosphate synthase CPT3-like [Nicotiana tabacum]|uniref:Alkyl transferase n=1 Tax=Nicotiana sylvestris TaxID=4096 RepID=A0A1U7WY34_NICSY|nr:PREDICTED: dehydrodolichyl diphosphate synthase 6-like [Nicotiana sylvestris]XP_009784824.1 PREDICTED: dehydrodolichyl diphosphate synthase 6-like [Nicotiana sylvestris]XP_009784832.1 PREDICTED: dehydrodolichyl diphosphate synthase 6-like [Nicotiana sylvestris]
MIWEHKMLKTSDSLARRLVGSSIIYMRRFLFRILSVGPIPNHIAFILDGNRRYAKKWNIAEATGYRAGFLAVMCMLKYCYELGVKYTTIYAFGIDNFKRRPEEVQYLMDLMLEKIEGLIKQESIVNEYGVRVHFVGDLKLLNERVRVAAEKAMQATVNNTNSTLLICVAYTSTDEILHAVQSSCLEKWKEIQELDANQAQNGEITEEKQELKHIIKLVDIERHTYMGLAPDPDVLIRTSGETRHSNFLLWQTTSCLLYSPKVLFPEIGLRHLVWAVLNFQRLYPHSFGEGKEITAILPLLVFYMRFVLLFLRPVIATANHYIQI